VLSSVVSRAKLAAMPRQVPVKLTVAPGLELTLTIPTAARTVASAERPLSFIESPFCTKATYSEWLALPAAQQQAALHRQMADTAPKKSPPAHELPAVQEDGDALRFKAAEVSAACAARAEARADAKAAAKAAAEAVKKALDEASAAAGLRGRDAKLKAAAAKAKAAVDEPTSQLSSEASSLLAASDVH